MKSKIIQLILSVFLISQIAYSQEWPKIYGDNFHALVNDMNETYDQGIILSGFIYLPYGFCRYIWIIKTDINGDLLWWKKIGDSSHQYGLTRSEITTDNGLIFSGGTTKYTGDFDPLFVKMNTCGEVEWCRVLSSPGYNLALEIINLPDNTYMGLLQYYGEGDTYARSNLIKLDQIGEPVWIQKLAQEDSTIINEELYNLLYSSDSNIIISGDRGPGQFAYWIKTDTAGNQIWDLKWQGGYGGARQVIETSNQMFYSAGGFAGPGYHMTPSIFKFDNSGTKIYQEYLLGDTLAGGGAEPMILYGDTSLITGIQWRTSNDVEDGYSDILKTDTLGNIINRRTLIHYNKCPKAIMQSSDNKVLVTGNYMPSNYWDIYLWKFNTNLEDDTLYTQPLTYDSLCPFEIQSDTMDLDCDLFVNIDELPTREEYESTVKIYPNPARDWVALTLPDVVAEGKVEIAVYDVFGREVETGRGGDKEMEGQGEVPVNRMLVLDVSGYPPGMYVVVVTDRKGRRYTGKVIVR
ncbi:MAG: T9SS type A sorting domain-containing protein [Bacteroidales bacterium]|nr:T9SS type A sorting domain-containing protein [Bacteroidales bacterium]